MTREPPGGRGPKSFTRESGTKNRKIRDPEKRRKGVRRGPGVWPIGGCPPPTGTGNRACEVGSKILAQSDRVQHRRVDIAAGHRIADPEQAIRTVRIAFQRLRMSGEQGVEIGLAAVDRVRPQ